MEISQYCFFNSKIPSVFISWHSSTGEALTLLTLLPLLLYRKDFSFDPLCNSFPPLFFLRCSNYLHIGFYVLFTHPTVISVQFHAYQYEMFQAYLILSCPLSGTSSRKWPLKMHIWNLDALSGFKSFQWKVLGNWFKTKLLLVPVLQNKLTFKALFKNIWYPHNFIN